MARLILWALAAMVAFALAITFFRPTGRNSVFDGSPFRYRIAAHQTAGIGVSQQARPLQSGAPITHLSPPEPRELENKPAAQASYDAGSLPPLR
jgi:hypothetical protein